MRKAHHFVIIGILCLTACGQPDEEDYERQEICTVQFQIQPSPEILPFQPTRGIPGNIPPEPGASAPNEEGGTSDLFSIIEYTIYNSETDEIVKQEQFVRDNTDEDFGSYLYDEFKAGDYKICLLAHSAPEVHYEGDCITFARVGDCFYTSHNLVVEPGEAEQSVELTLSRIVSRVEFLPTDDIPLNATSFQMEISGLYNTFNLLSGEAADTPKDTLIQHAFTPSDRQTASLYKPSFMTLLPGDGTKIGSVTLLTLQETTPIHTQTLKNIPLYANRTTRYTGVLFTPGLANGTFELNIENGGQWGEDVEYKPEEPS